LKSFYRAKIEVFEGTDKIDYEDIEDINTFGILL
jgi:hypothetical protein